jgi:purine nucleosidase
MLAAASNKIEILGITCVAGNTTLDNAKLNALKVCTLIGRTDINIYSGSDKPLKYELVTAEHVHGKSGLDIESSSIEIDHNYKINKLHAVDFIIQTCHENVDPIYLCPTGPLTNIALALKKDPTIANKNNFFYFIGYCGIFF